MLISNLWLDAGLVSGAMGTVNAICYRTGGPPDLPLAVMVKFDNYSGLTFHGLGTVPILPIRHIHGLSLLHNQLSSYFSS